MEFLQQRASYLLCCVYCDRHVSDFFVALPLAAWHPGSRICCCEQDISEQPCAGQLQRQRVCEAMCVPHACKAIEFVVLPWEKIGL